MKFNMIALVFFSFLHSSALPQCRQVKVYQCIEFCQTETDSLVYLRDFNAYPGNSRVYKTELHAGGKYRFQLCECTYKLKPQSAYMEIYSDSTLTLLKASTEDKPYIDIDCIKDESYWVVFKRKPGYTVNGHKSGVVGILFFRFKR